MEHMLAQERKARSAIAHPLDELEFVHFSLDDALTGRQGETSFDSLFVSEHSTNEMLQLADIAFFNTSNPPVEVLTCPCLEHLSELLGQHIRLIHFSMQSTQKGECLLFVGFQVFRITKEQEHGLS